MFRLTPLICKQIPTKRMISSSYSLSNEDICIKIKKLEIQVTTLQDKINILTNKVDYNYKPPIPSKIRNIKSGLHKYI